MAERYMLVAGGVDRKGIVYNLTNILKKNSFNIEDSSMLLLRRTFSIIMLLSIKKIKPSFERDLDEFRHKFGMSVELRKIKESDMKEHAETGNTFIISISGADKPGIVNEMTGLIFGTGGNIVGLETKSSEKVKPHVYYMFLEVDMPKKVKASALEKKMKAAGKKIGVHVTVNKAEKSIL